MEDGRLGPQCRTQRENFRERDPGHFQERESGSSVCLVPGGFHYLDQESGIHGLLHQQATRPGEGAWDQNEDAGEAGGQAVNHRLDFDEEKGALSSRLPELGMTVFCFRRESPSNNVEAVRTLGGTILPRLGGVT